MKQITTIPIRLLTLFLLLAYGAQGHWTKTNGPGTNMIRDLVEHNGALYLGSEGGIYKSLDSGSTWTYVSSGVNPPRGLYHLLSTPSALVCGSVNGIFRSNDGGQNWTQHFSGLSYINDMAQNSSTLFAATDQDKLKFSNDNGLTWTQTPDATVGNHLAVTGTHNQYVFVDGLNALQRSADNGISFISTPYNNLGLPGQTSIMSISSVGNNLYLGMYGAGLFVSTNNGAGFSPINNGLPSPGLFEVMKVHSHNQYLFAGLMGNSMPVYRSADGGQTWSLSSSGMVWGDGVLNFHSYGNRLFASTSRGLYVSTDNGNNWSYTNTGITNGYVDAIAANSSYIFAGTANRAPGGTQSIYRSNDNGMNWEELNNGITILSTNNIYADDSVVFISGNNQTLYRSTDNGSSWTDLSLSAQTGSDVCGIVKHGNDFFLITENTGIFHSIDYGVSWSLLPSSSTVNPLGYAIASDDTNLYVAAGMNTYQSSDNGLTWNNTGYISPSTYGTTFHPYGDYVYMGTKNEGMHRRHKSSNIWNPVNTGIPQPAWITDITSTGDSLFASTDANSFGYTKTIYLSTDSGITWSLFNQGMPQNTAVRCILVYDNFLFAGTGSLYDEDGRSVWYRNLANTTTGINQTTKDHSISVYPNPSDGIFHLQNTAEDATFTVINSQGAIVRNVENNGNNTAREIDLRGSAPGIFLLLIQRQQKIETVKMIVR